MSEVTTEPSSKNRFDRVHLVNVYHADVLAIAFRAANNLEQLHAALRALHGATGCKVDFAAYLAGAHFADVVDHDGLRPESFDAVRSEAQRYLDRREDGGGYVTLSPYSN